MIANEKKQSGFTFAELAFGLLIFVIAAAVMINHLSINYSTTRNQKDVIFAYSKAQGILSEIQAFVDRGEVAAAIDLDALDDGVINKPQLTITTQAGVPVPPDHPISNNFQRDGQWVWSRRITVQPFAGLNNRNVRYVTVQVYRRGMDGNETVLASISSVMNSVGSSYPTTQVYDLYLLAVENIPGWWVFMESIIPFVQSAITDLESRNPGVEIRTHWITKASYGRDQLYRPFINEVNDSFVDVPWTYYYPGRMPTGTASAFYYVPELINARMTFDGVERNGYDADRNPFPYALADFFNHGMRLPQERALHDQRVQAVRTRKAEIELARRNGDPEPAELLDMSEEPTLRLLMEDMATDPDRYRNALVINLHGELLPTPAIRNYSDPAKAPERLAGLRVVTHPEELRTLRDPTGAGIDPVRLRVYAYTTDQTYVTNQAAYTGPWKMPADAPIAIQVMGMDLTNGVVGTNQLWPGVRIEGIRGGVRRDGSRVPYQPLGAIPRRQDVGDPSEDMFYEVEWNAANNWTLIKLYNTPIVQPPVEDPPTVWRGVPNTVRGQLYGFEYVPAPCENPPTFGRDLYATGEAPKNTARWVIHVPREMFTDSRFWNGVNYHNPDTDVLFEARTRIWNPDPLWDDARRLSTGTVYPSVIEPGNVSVTYSWWAQSREVVPMTERSQFLGDPRHNPYKDLCRNDLDFPNGYNWYFDRLNTGVDARPDFPALRGSVLRNSWVGRLRQDVPRYFELFRTALVNTGAVYTTLTGFSYYYMGVGAEIGYDAANGYPNSIPTNLNPWGSTATPWFVNNITGNRWLPRQGDWLNWPNGWWGMPWLGETCPDTDWANWIARGNLSAGWGHMQYFLIDENWCHSFDPSHQAYGTGFVNGRQVTAAEGCTSFFNIGTDASTFHHIFSGGDSTVAGSGFDLANNYNFPIPTTAPTNRPFRLDINYHGGLGDEWNLAPYTTRFQASLPVTYYTHPPSGGTGSGLVELRNPAGDRSAYVVVNGISNAVASGSAFIAKYSCLTMVQSYLEGANPAMTNAIAQLPRVEIETPTEITELINPVNIPIRFGVSWRRWDGQKYATSTPNGYAEPESNLDYVVMYSRDNGTSWLVCNEEDPITPGQRPTDPTHIVADAGTGSETVTWNTPAATFPRGTYLVRVECYRRGLTLHYSRHQVRVFISR
jgi:hypothetical protein